MKAGGSVCIKLEGKEDEVALFIHIHSSEGGNVEVCGFQRGGNSLL